jgi:superfamily I DNA/RNA helicase
MILNSQIKSLKLVKEDLIKNNPELNKEIAAKITEKTRKLQLSFDTLKCKNISEENDSIQKLTLLRQTTYELCRYHSYLEYLREYNSNFENLDLPDDDSYNTNYIVKLEKERKDEINNEISHIYKIYPIAFSAYNQYENNVTIHILLELIKEDYVVFREALHNSINPINQVVYKISNAMNID